ncbi:MAG: putative toxin-antitoxin system toxin component, PIN family [Clostridiales bacterium]|nr:putative toxin-antitoxin system toxin component, PIN family [Clostridiales bacterium]
MSCDPIPRIVIDTSVFISAVLFRGPTSRLVSLWQKGNISVLMSSAILKEYARALAYPKFKLTRTEIRGIIEQELLPYVSPVKVKSTFHVITQDPSDDKFLELAQEGKANYILSGDKHLLDLKTFHGIKIITPNELFALIL